MPTTRSQTKITEENNTSKPQCYLAFGRYITQKEMNALDGCSGNELLSGSNQHGEPCEFVKSLKEKLVKKKKHPNGFDGKQWTPEIHYGMCGQSCPCCRKMVGDVIGACTICD